MANVRTINSPGVEIREIDLSTRAVTPVGTNVLVTGFAPQGPTYEIVDLNSLSDFEQIYGTPTNPAERYFYYSVRQLLTNGGNPTVKVARLPYGAEGGEGTASEYSALAFPVIAIPTDTTTYSNTQMLAGTIPLSSAQGYYFGEPALVKLTEDQYQTIAQGNFTWKATTGNIGLSSFVVSGPAAINSLSAAGLIVLNKAKTTINEKFEGYYLNIGDSYSNNPATDYDDAGHIWTVGSSYFSDGALASQQGYTFVPDTRIGFSLSAAYTAGINSLSKDVEDLPTFNIAASGYSDTLILSLFRVRPSPFSPTTTTLQYVLQEGYTGSLYSQRTVQDENGGQPVSFYLETSIDDNSNNLQLLVNPNISQSTVWLDANGNSTKRVRIFKNNTIATINSAQTSDPDYTFYGQASAYLAIRVPSFKPANNLYALGTYAATLPANQDKTIGNVSTKLDYVLNLAENTDVVDIDLVVDGGLSTIHATTVAAGTSAFDDTVVSTQLQTYINALSASDGNPVTTSVLLNNWNTITSQFESFTRNRRKDCLFLSDPLRQIFVTGTNYKTLDDKSKNFSQNIYWPLRNSYTAYNTSYATAYANWAKITDIFSSQSVWVPFSGYAGAMMTASDAATYPWIAPAGLTRGIINGLTDLGVNPQQKQRDLLYKISLNPVVFFPNEGYTVFGQKTLLKAPSAFDRINVRRLFLFLEKATLRSMRYFVFEPNTTFTRSRAVNTLAPLFELAKNTQGLYDYLIVCNETNNTADIIDDNTMVIDIYIKPVRTAEFILVNFYATKTSQNFNELLQA